MRLLSLDGVVWTTGQLQSHLQLRIAFRIRINTSELLPHDLSVSSVCMDNV